MSLIGKQPIKKPMNVKATFAGGVLTVEGPKGKLEQKIHPGVRVEIGENEITCSLQENDVTQKRAQYGLMRSLISNMVQGVSEGFSKELEVIGVGFRAAVNGKVLDLSLGFSHPVNYPIPDGIEVKVDKLTFIRVSGADLQLVGQVAAEIRNYRLPEPYKGKGVKYKNEVVRRKAGKAAGAGAAA